MKCDICGSTQLSVNRVNNAFHECDMCKTLTRIESNQLGEQFYSDNYFNDVDEITRTIELNRAHYINLFNSVANNNKYIDIKNDIYARKLDTVYCFGGGFPQLESFLPVNHIKIYDLVANQYNDNFNLFEKYCVDKVVEYNHHNVSDGVVPVSSPSILTFSHILEHLTIDTIYNIFESMSRLVVSGSYIIIYQPNPVMATKRTWLHWTYHSNEHITFIPINTFTKYINSFQRLDVKLSVPYSDDLLIIAKVE